MSLAPVVVTGASLTTTATWAPDTTNTPPLIRSGVPGSIPPSEHTSPVCSSSTSTDPPSPLPLWSPRPATNTPLPRTGSSALPAEMPASLAVMRTAGSGWRFQSVKAPCIASTPNPCGLSARPRTSADTTASPATSTCPDRTASSACRRTWPVTRTLRSTRRPRSVTDVSFPMATSCAGTTIVTSSSRLSRLSRTPFAPKRRVPPRRTTPGLRSIIGMPAISPSTSISSASGSASSSSSALDTLAVFMAAPRSLTCRERQVG
jgi:hypothetical protein